MADIATLLPTFQIRIPEAVREAHAWRPGQEFVFLPKGDGVLMLPMPTREEIGGIAFGANPNDYRDRDDSR